MRRKEKNITAREIVSKISWAILIATILIMLTPTLERDTGEKLPEVDMDDFYQKPTGNTAFLHYIQKQGYTVTKNQLPILIEVQKKQVDKSPNDVVEELAKIAHRMTGKNVKVILRTWGGKYIAEYNE
ncbi:hypothetical protein J7L68_05060 [bacterium]|nr:hypothetical protein [bacterium]